MTQKAITTQPPPDLYHKAVDILINQSAGALISPIVLCLIAYHWLGGKQIIKVWLDSQKAIAEGLKDVANTLKDVVNQISNQSQKHSEENDRIINKLDELSEKMDKKRLW
jgi:gas vesicle protein